MTKGAFGLRGVRDVFCKVFLRADFRQTFGPAFFFCKVGQCFLRYLIVKPGGCNERWKSQRL